MVHLRTHCEPVLTNQPKKEQPKEEAPEDDEDEDACMREEKVKIPLDLLPKSTFDLDQFKRCVLLCLFSFTNY